MLLGLPMIGVSVSCGNVNLVDVAMVQRRPSGVTQHTENTGDAGSVDD